MIMFRRFMFAGEDYLMVKRRVYLAGREEIVVSGFLCTRSFMSCRRKIESGQRRHVKYDATALQGTTYKYSPESSAVMPDPDFTLPIRAPSRLLDHAHLAINDPFPDEASPTSLPKPEKRRSALFKRRRCRYPALKNKAIDVVFASSSLHSSRALRTFFL